MRAAGTWVAVALSVLCWSGGAVGEECASVGPRAYVDSPRGAAPAPPNVRVRVCLSVSCGGITGGPDHQFRILDTAGAPIPFAIEPWGPIHVELVPSAALAAGAYRLEVRRPISQTELGDWVPLQRFEVAGEPDGTAPVLAGLQGGAARALVGDHFVPPDMLEPGWVVAFTLEFAVASDGDRDPGELLYVVDRRTPGAGEWERDHRIFRARDRTGTSRFEWDSEQGWGESWEYRLRVRDIAGHEVTGAATTVVTNPAQPTTPIPGHRGGGGGGE